MTCSNTLLLPPQHLQEMDDVCFVPHVGVSSGGAALVSEVALACRVVGSASEGLTVSLVVL